MNARLQANVLRIAKPAAIAIPKQPVRLTPIPWGKPDAKTARVVLQNMVDTTPGIDIPWNVRDAKIRRLLHAHRVETN